MRGAGETTPHRRKSAESEEEKENKVPMMVLNYHFMSTRGAENVKGVVLAMKDESTGNRYLRAVGQKGVEGMEWLAKDRCEEFKSWGHMGGAGGRIVIENRRGVFDCCLKGRHTSLSRRNSDPRGTTNM